MYSKLQNPIRCLLYNLDKKQRIWFLFAFRISPLYFFIRYFFLNEKLCSGLKKNKPHSHKLIYIYLRNAQYLQKAKIESENTHKQTKKNKPQKPTFSNWMKNRDITHHQTIQTYRIYDVVRWLLVYFLQ